mmetsp:Transcript_20756/g.34294  ORF Transcript_20756/g.34294 Transcript_20756/m.34294 type:complete len:440 (+) Transcript_20756:185-1504(+)
MSDYYGYLLAVLGLAICVVSGLAWKLAIMSAIVVILAMCGNEALERSPEQRPGIVRKFTFKNQFDGKANIMQGISFGPWFEILRNRWRHIDWRTYWLRVLHITVLSLINSVLALLESVIYGSAVEGTKINERPVFILGHPRTGTTHLFNVLSKDTEQFIFPNTFQCGFPNGMLTLEKYSYLFAGLIDKKRPMDNMYLDFSQPQEDELALNVLTAGTSPYMPLVFMNREPEFRDFFSFEKATLSDKARWVGALKHFMKKVTFSASLAPGAKKERRLLLKSPVHCSRAKLLHQLFPKAQFVYIHRNPYVVWKSAVNMADTTYWHSYLAKPTDEHITEFILNQYEVLFEDYIEARKTIPKEQLREISFQELTDDPIGSIGSLYKYFGWDSFQDAKPLMESYLAGLATYRKNTFVPLDDKERSYIYKRWKRSFDEFGYKEQEI